MSSEPAARIASESESVAISDRAKGTLVLAGGACSAHGKALRAFIDLADAHTGTPIIGLTTASSDPEGAAVAWRSDLQRAGATNVRIPIFDRNPDCDEEVAAMIAEASGVFFGGGDQVKLVSSLSGTKTCAAIKQLFIRGGVVCGTSAGAAALSALTMAGGEVDDEGNLVDQYIGPGLGLLGFHTVVDTHFSQRRRLQRLFVVVAQHPTLMGLGIDEDTSLVVRGHIGEVIGAGGVTFVDGRDSVRFNNAAEIEQGRRLTISHLRIGIVGSHYRLNLRERDLDILVRG